MATQHRQQPSRLFIPPMLNSQLANSVDARTMFSPALHTANQAHFPPFPPNSAFSMQTPMQQSFFPHPPNAPPRPHHPPHMGHRQHASMAGFGGLAMHPVPMTPLGQQFPPNMMHGGPSGMQPHAPPFIPKSRRTPSMIGGPPKAALGGPGRKVSPMPAAAAVVQEKLKGKKVAVKVPHESERMIEGGESEGRKETMNKSLWTRRPVSTSLLPEQPQVDPPDTSSADVYPVEEYKNLLPPTVDVFLPGKAAWDEMRQRLIEEKLEKLGVVEKRPEFTSGVPEIHAPHARAASISSPADPALLYFKLNKLQQQQQSAGNSLSTSPQPPSSSISPDLRFPNRMQAHGHSMSLAHPPTFHPHPFTGPGGYDLLSDGERAVLDDENEAHSPRGLFAPQGRKLVQLGVPPSSSRPESRPDFVRGFGLDIPEEEEEEEEEKENMPPVPAEESFAALQPEISQTEPRALLSEVKQQVAEEEPPLVEEEPELSMAQTAVDGHSQHASTVGVHTRHASRISVTLSVGSAPRYDETVVDHNRKESRASIEMGQFVKELEQDEVAAEFSNDPLNEWTGSEDLARDDDDDDATDDQESIGEWSNPSDEERARQDRLQRRYMRRLHEVQEIPRRLPQFPRPPESTKYVTMRGDEEDIISNPSEEEMPARRYTAEELGVNVNYDQYFPQTSISMPLSHGDVARSSRPLPPLPDSRDGSSLYSYHGSMPSHSRNTSEQLINGIAFAPSSSSLPTSRPDSNMSGHGKTTSISSTNKGSLNPFAKPFVFGAKPSFVAPTVLSSSVPASVSGETNPSPAPSGPIHSRLPSIGAGRPLNVAAPEFKPGNFTFRAPAGLPTLSFPAPIQPQHTEAPRPLPIPPAASLSREVQGREKRQRLSESPEASDVDDIGYSEEEEEEFEDEDEEGRDTMSSFKFPVAPEPTMVFHRSAPASPTPSSNLHGTQSSSGGPFTFNGFPGKAPVLPPLLGQETRSLAEAVALVARADDSFRSFDATRGSALENTSSPELTLPNSQKQKRAPIPLDFKHPVSTKLVPAGLFKNLASNDVEDKARQSAHHSNSFELSNQSDVSLDDLSVPAISHKISRVRLRPERQDRSQDDLEGASQAGEASSMHSRRSSIDTPISPDSIVPPDMASFSQSLRVEERLEALLDRKLKTLRKEVLAHSLGGDRYISSSTDEMVREAMAMFRTQLHDSTEKALEDSAMDARGEFDFEMIKSIIEDSQDRAHMLLFQKLATLLGDIKEIDGTHRQAPSPVLLDLLRLVEDLKADVLTSTARLHDTLATRESAGLSQAWQKDALVRDIVGALAPHLNAVRAEPIDYDGLTMQLSQAVKPHISQLIDLASDKRETAELIANRLMPILQSFAASQPEIDTESIVADVTTAVSRVIEPIDTHVMKEQVADLVVERLDARLAVRDKSLNFDNLKANVMDTVLTLTGHFDALGESIESLKITQSDMVAGTKETASAHVESAKALDELGKKLGGLVEVLTSVKTSVSLQQQSTDTTAQQLQRIIAGIESLTAAREGLADERNEIITLSKRMVDDLSPIPEAVAASFDKKYSELLERVEKIQRSAQEVRKLSSTNADLQGKLAKAQAAHGLIRVEKEDLKNRLTKAETERDSLLSKLEQLELVAKSRTDEIAALEARTADQEEAMRTALDRLKVSDVTAQTHQERIAELEKAAREMNLEKQSLKSKIDHLNLQVEFAARDKESSQQALRLLQADRDNLAAQQNQWEDLRRASEQIEMLANHMSRIESDEVVELRKARDRSKALEGEHAALQKRFREQESKLTNIERASTTARQNFAQAQQRAAEWEKRAREAEGEVERLSTVVEQGEQTRVQLEADVQMVKMQMEEKDAQERLREDRERKLEEEIATMKTKIADLSSELEEERKVSRAASNQWVMVGQKQNNVAQRPPSRASTAYDDPEPPTPKLNGRGLPPSSTAKSAASTRTSAVASPEPASSTWDSMHAPKSIRSSVYAPRTMPSTPTPRGHRASGNVRNRAPSPTPSVVSVAPTQGEDGWWS